MLNLLKSKKEKNTKANLYDVRSSFQNLFTDSTIKTSKIPKNLQSNSDLSFLKDASIANKVETISDSKENFSNTKTNKINPSKIVNNYQSENSAKTNTGFSESFVLNTIFNKNIVSDSPVIENDTTKVSNEKEEIANDNIALSNDISKNTIDDFFENLGKDSNINFETNNIEETNEDIPFESILKQNITENFFEDTVVSTDDTIISSPEETIDAEDTFSLVQDEEIDVETNEEIDEESLLDTIETSNTLEENIQEETTNDFTEEIIENTNIEVENTQSQNIVYEIPLSKESLDENISSNNIIENNLLESLVEESFTENNYIEDEINSEENIENTNYISEDDASNIELSPNLESSSNELEADINLEETPKATSRLDLIEDLFETTFSNFEIDLSENISPSSVNNTEDTLKNDFEDSLKDFSFDNLFINSDVNIDLSKEIENTYISESVEETVESSRISNTSLAEEVLENSLLSQDNLNENNFTTDNITKSNSVEETNHQDNSFIEEDIENSIIEEESYDDVLKDNNTLLISEEDKKVFLPYTIEEVEMYLNQYPDKYTNHYQVIRNVFTFPLNYFNSFFYAARFREAYSLYKDSEGYSSIQSILNATKIMKITNLHPAIIAACKTEKILKNYLYHLEKDDLENFTYFDINYKITPLS